MFIPKIRNFYFGKPLKSFFDLINCFMAPEALVEMKVKKWS